MQAMVVLGQRPAERDPLPSMCTWLRHLTSIYQARPVIPREKKKTGPTTWPLFPIDAAPWPLLMPLVDYRYPIREADYLWNKFQGKTGGGRFHTYGPYRTTNVRLPYLLQPMPWHWRTVPSEIVVGGVCTVMSRLEVATRVCLCQPAMLAGQPGHQCLMVSSLDNNGTWNIVVHQAGMRLETWPPWFFKERVPHTRTIDKMGSVFVGVEYQLGLTCAINRGLSSYMDTRIAVNLYRAMPAAQQQAPGKHVLEDALRINPFNAEAWFYLAQATPDALSGFALVRAAYQGTSETLGHDEEIDTTVALHESVRARLETANPAKAVADYWRILREHVRDDAITRRPIPADPTDARRVYDFLRQHGGATMPYRLRFEGKDAVCSSLQAQIRTHLAQRAAKQQKAGAKESDAELRGFVAGLSPEDARESLSKLKALFPGGAQGDPFFDALRTAAAVLDRKTAKKRP